MKSYLGKTNLNAMRHMSRYNKWIYDTISPYLGTSVLEAGCGNGNITYWISQTPGLKRYLGLDLDPHFEDTIASLFKNKPDIEWSFEPINLQNLTSFDVSDHPFDSIVCLNVLEHIRDDLKTLGHFYSIIKRNGRLILQVPAFQILFGSIDEINQHYRRYNKRNLSQKVQKAGFKIEKCFYFNLFGIYAWIWHSKILRVRHHWESDLKRWDKAVSVLQKFENRIRPPIGLSVFLIATKEN